MRCRTCGNEVSSEEAFCGQCGTPVATPQALQTEMTPPSQSGRSNSYAPNETFGQQNDPPERTRPLSVQGASPSASHQQSSAPQFSSGQSTGFYRDATEAMPLVPSNPNVGYQQPYPVVPPAHTFPPQSTPTSYGFPSQVSQPQGQPLQAGNYAGQGYPQQQGYRALPTPPQRQRNGAVIFIVSMCLVVALLSVVGVGTLYVLRGRNATPQNSQTPGIVPTATAIPTNVPTPTATPSPTQEPTATPTPIPTAAPVAGFAYCGTLCTNNGFSTQYPQTWAASPYTGGQGVQFVNVNPNDQMAIFKTPGATSSAANDLVSNDVQQNFASKNNYQVVTPTSADSLGGETWFKEVISYQEDGQPKEMVEVYATVHQGKAYILELQASEDQFGAATGQYFATIKGQFQFQ